MQGGIRSRLVTGVGELDMHVLEAGFAERGRPAILLLHGFPELAYSWKRVMPILAAAGYHVIAPDQRGFGRTTVRSDARIDDLEAYATGNLANDLFNLLAALGLDSVAAIVGHDAGSIVAGYCAIAWPGLMRCLVLSASPFAGPPPQGAALPEPFLSHPVHAEISCLPHPRKHYQAYFAGPHANTDMQHAPQGLHSFLRGYYHLKSADWNGNAPHPLCDWSAEQFALLPDYYCMPSDRTMPEIAAAGMPDARTSVACSWLSDSDLAFISGEFERTGFQPALNWYRSALAEGTTTRDLLPFCGRRIEVPVSFVAGRADWGPYQIPGLLAAMQDRLASSPVTLRWIDGAGHWPHLEQPQAFAAEVCAALSAAG